MSERKSPHSDIRAFIPKSMFVPLYSVVSEHVSPPGHGPGIYKGFVSWGGLKRLQSAPRDLESLHLLFFFFIVTVRQSHRQRASSEEGWPGFAKCFVMLHQVSPPCSLSPSFHLGVLPRSSSSLNWKEKHSLLSESQDDNNQDKLAPSLHELGFLLMKQEQAGNLQPIKRRSL